MATLPSSGPLSINDIRNVMGGPASPSMANYYRGGAYVPSTKTVTTNTREPSSGEYYKPTNPNKYEWYYEGSGGITLITWDSTTVFSGYVGEITSRTVGSTTYYRGSLRFTDTYGGRYYAQYRIVTTTSTTNINTSVPTSGQISINNFYGAEKP